MSSSPRKSEHLLIQSYFHAGEGYHPFLIGESWQIAQLNYMPTQHSRAVGQVERHNATDEAFVLLKGRSLLLAALETSAGLEFETCPMQPGVTYNVPAGCWHNILMIPGDLVIIIEKANTHLHDVERRTLTSRERDAMAQKLADETMDHECA